MIYLYKKGGAVKKLMLLMIIVVSVSGCATFRRDNSVTTQLQMRVGELEREIQSKDQRIADLEYKVKDLMYDVKKMEGRKTARTPIISSDASMPPKVKGETIRLDVDHKDVQQALKNAGYYEGAIDGKVGSGTKAAILQFQKDNGLKSDGLLGQETWAVLRGYLN